MANEYWDRLTKGVPRLSSRQRAVLVAGAAQRVFDVVLDDERAKNSAAKQALRAMWDYSATGNLNSSAYPSIREELADDQLFAAEQLSAATACALKSTLEAFVAIGKDDVEASLNALADAVTVSFNADEAHAAEAEAEEKGWQLEVLQRMIAGDALLQLEDLRGIGHWPPEWLLRFEGA